MAFMRRVNPVKVMFTAASSFICRQHGLSMALHCIISMVAILRALRAPRSVTAPVHPPPLELPPPSGVTMAPGSSNRHEHALQLRRGQLEMQCLGWVQAIVWHYLQMVHGERRGEATLGRDVLVAGKRHSSSSWGLIRRAGVTVEERSSMQAAVPFRAMCNFPMTQGILVAEPFTVASFAKAGGRVRPPPCQVVGNECSPMV